MIRSRNAAALAFVLLLTAACAAPNAGTHTSLKQTPERPLPRKVLLLPTDIRVHEISVGGVVEKVDAWSEEASAHVLADLRERTHDRSLFELADPPGLGTEDRALLEQHAALYEAVAGSAFLAQASPIQAWRARWLEFDYTLGPGLAGLAERTGLDAALVVIGTDHISSAGRKAAMVMGTVLAALAGVVIAPQGGIAFLSVGVVDLRTGDLLWFDTEQSGSVNLRDKQAVKAMLDRMFATYPGAAVQPVAVKASR